MEAEQIVDIEEFCDAVVLGAALGCASIFVMALFKRVPDTRRILNEISESDETLAYGASCGMALMSLVTLLSKVVKKAMCVTRRSQDQGDAGILGPERTDIPSSALRVYEDVHTFDVYRCVLEDNMGPLRVME